MSVLRGREDPALAAVITRIVPLRYAAGADPALDRPAHVRAGSGLAWIGGVLAVVQDDAAFLALIDPRTGEVNSLPLPAEDGVRQFGDDRGNKARKPDLESCVVLPDADGAELLAAFGSGSTPARERIVFVRGIPARPRVEVHHAPAFYAALHAARDFAGSELNVEGAAWDGGELILVNRGNGAVVDGRQPADATCRIHWPALLDHLRGGTAPPVPGAVTAYDLGEVDGSRLTFTDVAAFGGRIVFTAAAEASPNTYDDGPVAGAALGVLAAGGARWALLRDAAGRPFDGKVEGVAPGREPGTALVVVDRDDPRRPSDLCTVELRGNWPVPGNG
ncbi:DUF6929 family protein [Longimicrobium terrae]|uniref:DUF3616 domain-containing protein n=1 Tax=Longimicrobium terrae TaxID=1639882 RepID=A0A841H162_9BACT|nr:hypothetical protein [Longimicrobium terrae]MBB4637345.1 hypothetical protein [Longimicrobium terrae]MBB6071743.1 hypothetical protein [Longimicrobium terrae]NNC28504.1 hypothetical protein [Longimicrobium terrae]